MPLQKTILRQVSVHNYSWHHSIRRLLITISHPMGYIDNQIYKIFKTLQVSFKLISHRNLIEISQNLLDQFDRSGRPHR